MKRILLLAASLLATAASAQNYTMQRIDASETTEGIALPAAAPAVAVDVVVSCEQVITGPYARYAQKYLGVRAPLSDKTVYEITGANIALLPADAPGIVAGAVPATTVEAESYDGSATEFARISPDRLSDRNIAPEAAAQAAASEIFRIRRQRMQLITGEEGENVFGAGLKAAIDELHALEAAYTSLFLGKRVVTTQTRRYIVHPVSDRTSYIVARFSAQEGMLPAGDLSGEVVLLQIRPTGELAVTGIAQASEKERAVTVRIADNAECKVLVGAAEKSSVVLPLLAFGRNVRIPIAAKK